MDNSSLIINCNKEDIPNIDISKFKNQYLRIYFNFNNNINNIISKIDTKYYTIWDYNKDINMDNIQNHLNLDIFICAHKNFNNIIDNENYKILINDNIKISNNTLITYFENPENSELFYLQKGFGEFTKMWYVYKNLPLKKYIGFCHYDRYFEFGNDIPDIDELFESNDILALKGNIKESIFDQYKNNHITFDEFIDCLNILIKKYNYTWGEVFDVFNSNDLYICNIFIMKRNDFKKYCEFIYSIISEFLKDKNITNQMELRNYLLSKYKYINEISFEERFLGYIIERLTTFFIIKNFKKIYNLNVTYIQGDILYKGNVDKIHYFTIATNNYNKYLYKQFKTIDYFLPNIEKTYNIISDRQTINDKNINYYHICHLPYPLVTDNKIYYIMDIINNSKYSDNDYFAFFDADTYFIPKSTEYWENIKEKLIKYDIIFSISPWILEYYDGKIWEYENSPEDFFTNIDNPNPKTYCQGSFFMGKISALRIFIKYYEELYYAEMNKIVSKGVYKRDLPPMGDQQIFNKILDETINKQNYKYNLNLCVDFLFMNNYNESYKESKLINKFPEIFFIQKYNNGFKKNIRTD